jgi:hypothetical protein
VLQSALTHARRSEGEGRGCCGQPRERDHEALLQNKPYACCYGVGGIRGRTEPLPTSIPTLFPEGQPCPVAGEAEAATVPATPLQSPEAEAATGLQHPPMLAAQG